jgi:hypothetical protein
MLCRHVGAAVDYEAPFSGGVVVECVAYSLAFSILRSVKVATTVHTWRLAGFSYHIVCWATSRLPVVYGYWAVSAPFTHL